MTTKNFFNHRVLWLLIPLLTLFNLSAWGAATLPVDYTLGGSSYPTGCSGSGITLQGYAAGNAPYRLKFDSNGDYLQIEVDGPVGAISIGIKEFGTSGASIQIQGCTTASGTYATIQTLNFSNGQNKTGSQTTSNAISSDYRFFRIKRNSGSNFGLGTLQMSSACNKSVTLTYDGDADTHGCTFVLKAGSSSGSTIAEGGTTANCGSGTTTVAVVTTPADHYHVASVTATNKTGDISDQGSGVYHISYTQGSNISSTVTVTFEADPTYTVTWVAGSNPSFSTQTNYAGTALTDPGIPSPASYCPGGKIFVGWTANTISGEQNSAPADLFTSVSGKTIPVNGTTYYAVWATASTSSFASITNARDLITSDYVIAYTYSSTQIAMGNTNNGTDKVNASNISLTDSKYSSPGAAYIWRIEKQNNGSYKLYNANASKYLNATTSALQVGNSGTEFNITYDSGWLIQFSSNTRRVHGYINNGNYDFRQSTSTYKVLLYRNELSAYATTCCTPLASINGSFFVRNTQTIISFSLTHII